MEKKNIGFDSSIDFSKTSKGKIYWSNIRVSPINLGKIEKAIYEATLLEEKYNLYEEEKQNAKS